MRKLENSQPLQSFPSIIHRAPWIVTDSLPELRDTFPGVVEDGALLVTDRVIQAIGKYKDIVKKFGQYPTREHEGRVLVPALLNGHCHLELSYSRLADRTPKQKSYHNAPPTRWIKDLLREREEMAQQTGDVDRLIYMHARETLQQMRAEGVVFVGDVGNTVASRTIGAEQDIRVYFLLELLGLSREAEAKAIARLEQITSEEGLDIGCTPHSPYSTSAALIRAIKEKAGRQGRIFSIHVAESEQETDFLRFGAGVFREFLFERGVWDGNFSVPGMSSVHYLDSLGVLDDKTLCVHSVHVDHVEIEILAKKKVKICLCPGSNRFLGVGKAPVTEFVAHGMLPALGTDSKASNAVLSMWREMRLLREDQPALPPEKVFAMATLGGAEAWGVAAELGSLEPGKQARVVAVPCDEKINAPRDIFEFLTTREGSVRVEWLE